MHESSRKVQEFKALGRDVLDTFPPKWQDQGRCAGDSLPEEFFPLKSETGTMKSAAWLVETMCESCPVRMACLASAVAFREPHGVWGGEVFPVHAHLNTEKTRRVTTTLTDYKETTNADTA